MASHRFADLNAGAAGATVGRAGRSVRRGHSGRQPQSCAAGSAETAGAACTAAGRKGSPFYGVAGTAGAWQHTWWPSAAGLAGVRSVHRSRAPVEGVRSQTADLTPLHQQSQIVGGGCSPRAAGLVCEGDTVLGSRLARPTPSRLATTPCFGNVAPWAVFASRAKHRDTPL